MKVKQTILFSQKDLKVEIGEITKDSITPFVTNGKWSNHDLLAHLLTLAGPADVFVSTFSIGQTSMNTFFSLFKKGLVKKMEFLIDYTARQHRFALTRFAANMGADVRYHSNHSKIILISNDDWKITVVSSGNMTPNPRYEAGVIFTVPNVHKDYSAIYSQIFKDSRQWNLTKSK